MYIQMMEHFRIDKVASSDTSRPALCNVYIDLNHAIMYAADGYTLAVVPITVNDYDGELNGPIAVPKDWMAWLMGRRGDYGIVVVDQGKVLTLHRGDRRIAVDKEMHPDNLKLAKGIASVAGSVLGLEPTVRVMFNVNHLRNLVLAGGGHKQVSLAITQSGTEEGGQEVTSPLLVRTGEAGAIMMPFVGDVEKALAKARDVLEAMPGVKEEDEPEDSETTDGTPEADKTDPKPTG
jgi:hypothetical protein